jgi:hypothetical protein
VRRDASPRDEATFVAEEPAECGPLDASARISGDDKMKRVDTPFPRHWRYYVVLKFVVIAAALALALKYFGYW